MSLANLRDLIIIIFGILGILAFIFITVLEVSIHREMRATLNEIKDSVASAAWIAALIQGMVRAVNLFRKPSTKR